MGNHEEVFLRAVAGDLRALRFLIRIGGRETLLSYGISEEEYRELDYDELMALVQREGAGRPCRVPVRRSRNGSRSATISSSMPACGPASRSRTRRRSDLCWIRDDFLRHRESFGKMVVHGQASPRRSTSGPTGSASTPAPIASGRLTAIGLEGDERWYLST